MIAYDLVDRTDGGADILVYDNNQEFQPQELTSADSHTTREANRSVIHVNAARSQWTFNRGSKVSTGGGDKLFASSRNAIPSNPALPGGPDLLDGLAYVIFGSGDGSVRTTGPDAGAEYLPELNDTAQPGAAGVVGRRDGKPITHTVRGVKSGRYSQAVVGKGSVASIETTTADGVQDQTSGVPGGDGVRFEGLGKAPTRPVSLDVGTNEKGSARRATVSTRSAAGGSRRPCASRAAARWSTPTTGRPRRSGSRSRACRRTAAPPASAPARCGLAGGSASRSPRRTGGRSARPGSRFVLGTDGCER